VDFGILRGPCWFLPGPTGGNGLDLNRYEFLTSRPSVSSTTEVHRTDSFKTPTLPSNSDSGSSTTASNEQNNQCTWSVASSLNLDRSWPPDPVHYYPPSDAVNGSSRAGSLNKTTTEHD
jgi:hypothetical protein